MTVIKVNQPAIRNIELRAMMRRLTMGERIAIREFIRDTDTPVEIRGAIEDIYEDLRSTPNVQLDLPEVREGLEAFVATGLLAPERVDECLVDGTEAERYVK